MSRWAVLWASTVVACAGLFEGLTAKVCAAERARVAVARVKGGGEARPATSLRVRAVGRDGILVVYDAPASGAAAAGSDLRDAATDSNPYIVLWRDFDLNELFVYDRPVKTRQEVVEAIVGLGEELGVDPGQWALCLPCLTDPTGPAPAEWGETGALRWLPAGEDTLGKASGVRLPEAAAITATMTAEGRGSGVRPLVCEIIAVRATVPPLPERPGDGPDGRGKPDGRPGEAGAAVEAAARADAWHRALLREALNNANCFDAPDDDDDIDDPCLAIDPGGPTQLCDECTGICDGDDDGIPDGIDEFPNDPCNGGECCNGACCDGSSCCGSTCCEDSCWCNPACCGGDPCCGVTDSCDPVCGDPCRPECSPCAVPLCTNYCDEECFGECEEDSNPCTCVRCDPEAGSEETRCYTVPVRQSCSIDELYGEVTYVGDDATLTAVVCNPGDCTGQYVWRVEQTGGTAMIVEEEGASPIAVYPQTCTAVAFTVDVADDSICGPADVRLELEAQGCLGGSRGASTCSAAASIQVDVLVFPLRTPGESTDTIYLLPNDTESFQVLHPSPEGQSVWFTIADTSIAKLRALNDQLVTALLANAAAPTIIQIHGMDEGDTLLQMRLGSPAGLLLCEVPIAVGGSITFQFDQLPTYVPYPVPYGQTCTTLRGQQYICVDSHLDHLSAPELGPLTIPESTVPTAGF